MKRGVTLALVVILVATALGAGSYWLNDKQKPAVNPSNIDISNFEQRVFKTVTLKNGLKAVLVSDPSSDKSAAALNVFTGSWANPTDVQGMAHFLEHMLFLGTEKYPEVDGYQTFIEQNGGSDNAYTSSENTLYYFDINADQLEPALDRFSQFFIAPLFDPEFSEREQNAVHSEYSASLQNDERRIEDVIRELVSAQHPASKLAIGNLVTLNAPDIRDRLQAFFRQYYVAGNMSVAIVGPQDIATLEAMVETYFSGIRDVDFDEQRFLQPIFDSNTLPMLVEIKPRREMRRLEFRFPISGTADQLDLKPHQYVGHLLGHESTGSLLSVLKEKGWAENLVAGGSELTHSNTTFDIQIDLTPDGLKNWQAVAELLFSEIELIRTDGVQPWIFEEQKNINQISFQFAEKVAPASTAVKLAERLRYYPAQQILSGPYHLGEFQAEPIQRVLEQLKPDNALVVLVHPEAKTKQESEYYNTPYTTSALTGNAVASWRNPSQIAELKLPEPNPFVPTELTVQPLEREESILYKYNPQLVATGDNRVVWFEQDDEFKTPKTDINLLLESNIGNESVANAVALNLYIELVNDALNEVRYQAGLAGSGYGISLTDRGVQIRLYGYQNKLGLLLDTLILELVEHRIEPERFAIKREEYLRRLRNGSEDPVINQVIRRVNEWMVSNSFSLNDQIKAVQKLNAQQLLDVRTGLLTNAKLTMLIHGNMLEAQAKTLADRVDAVIPQQGTQSAYRKIAKIDNKNYIDRMNIDHADSAFLQLHQGLNSSLRERALYALLAEAMSAPYFAELRTKEQLGYIVLARAYPMDGMPGLILYVQSPTTDPALLQLYSDRFLSRYAQAISDMNEPTFEAYKQGLITTLTEPDKNLFELSSRYWSNILENNSHFNTRLRIANEVDKISLDGFRRFYNNRILGDERHSLTIHQIGKGMGDDYSEHEENIIGFYPIDTPKNWPKEIKWITPTFNNLKVVKVAD